MIQNNYMRLALILESGNAVTISTNIYKLIKGTLYFEDKEMNAFEISSELQKLFSLEYTPEELLKVLKQKNFDGLISCDNYQPDGLTKRYMLTPEEYNKFKNKQYEFYFDEVIQAFQNFLFKKYSNKKYEDEDLKNIIQNFLYNVFCEDSNTIKQLINTGNDLLNTPISKLNNDEKKIINDFLNWDNDEKNQFLYRSVSCGIDYCMLSLKKDVKTFSHIFKGKIFYLDTNIIFRLLGVNSLERQKLTKTFIKKCQSVGISIRYTNHTLKEIESSIKYNVNNLQVLYKNNQPLNPEVLDYAGFIDADNGFIRAHYEWAKQNNRNINYDAFLNYLKVETKKILNDFEMDSFESFNRGKLQEKFKTNFEDLKTCKESTGRGVNQLTVSTDVNNYMYIRGKNEKTKSKDITNMNNYMISADQILINWAKGILVGCTPCIILPSVWYSIILKYQGRTLDDFKAFTQFFNFRINDGVKINSSKKRALDCVLELDESSDIKEEILVDIEEKLSNDDYTFDMINILVNESHKTITQNHVAENANELQLQYTQQIAQNEIDVKNETLERLKNSVEKKHFILARMPWFMLRICFFLIPLIVGVIIAMLINRYSKTVWFKNISWLFGPIFTYVLNSHKGKSYETIKKKSTVEYQKNKYIEKMSSDLNLT